MKDQILDLIKERGLVSFAQMQRLLGDGFEGEYTMTLNDYPSIILWTNVSKEVVNAIEGLLQKGKIKALPTSFWTYLIDGRGLDLPIAERLNHSRKKQWLPIVFDSGF